MRSPTSSNQLERTLTSLEIAEMVGREHNEVLKDLRRIKSHLTGGILPPSPILSKAIMSDLDKLKIEPVNYFIESTYKGGNGREIPCNQVY